MLCPARCEVLSTLCGKEGAESRSRQGLPKSAGPQPKKGSLGLPLPAQVARSEAERAGREAGIVQACSAKQQKARSNGEILPLFDRNGALFSWTGRGPFSFRQGEKRMGGGTVPSAGTANSRPILNERKWGIGATIFGKKAESLLVQFEHSHRSVKQTGRWPVCSVGRSGCAARREVS